ncbi:MAG: T9SS type A sorting domain-containing protein [Saprospiraceae bacterium]|nr:MAG: T9SS type A sorting domain-containing protein [Saprospiraceae bacterium]
MAQLFNRLNVPVTVNGAGLLNPWAGGLNAPQWSAADLDDDGKTDLYAFDRNGSKHIAWRNAGSNGQPQWEFAPYLTTNFPFCKNFVLLRDYNRDGAIDIFAHAGDEGIPGFKVYRGHFENGILNFERLKFPQWSFDVLVYPTGGGNFTNVLANPPDYPAVDDIDGDGDLDILSINGTGGYVQFYENMAIEMGYTDDTLIYEFNDPCWGKFFIAPFAEELLLSPDPSQCAQLLGNPNDDEDARVLHGGGTLCTYDADNDGDKELLYGDLIFPKIVRALNGGEAENAWVTDQDIDFPTNDVPVHISDFPASYYLDFDNDGIKDFMASPNVPNSSVDRDVAWFYKNVQTNEAPLFQLQQKQLIIEDMLDFGTGAQPAFLDYNADGLMDFVVANFNAWLPDFQNDPYLFLFENTGTATEPKFELVDSNWLDFHQFASETYSFAPAFGDMDGDGDPDLVTGERYGSLFYAENLAGPGNPMSFGPIQPNWQGINVGQYSTPFIFDLNGDGANDLIIGERNGNVNYLPNQGTPESASFHTNPDEAPNNKFLGKINTQQPGYVTGYSAPVILDFGDTTYLITGSEFGYFELYIVDADSLDFGTSFQVVSEQFGGLRDGGISRIAFANLNGDDLLEAIVGNNSGGLGIFSSPINVFGTVDAKETTPVLAFELFPNPTGSELFVSLPQSSSQPVSYRLFDAFGRQVLSGTFREATGRVSVSDLVAGVYYLQATDGVAAGVRKFVKR